MVLTAPFRLAARADCLRIAELYRNCSGGVADYAWDVLRDRFPGLGPLEIGAAVLAGDGPQPSYRDAVVADHDGIIAATLLGHKLSGTADSSPYGPVDQADVVLAPYHALRAPGSWCIRMLSVDPRYQSLGMGTRLLRIARRLAIEHGCAELSAVVFEQNVQCVRAFKRAGFEVRDRARIVEHRLIRYTGHALLVCAPATFSNT